MEVTLTLTQAAQLADFLAGAGDIAYHIADQLEYAEDETIKVTLLPQEVKTFELARKYLEI